MSSQNFNVEEILGGLKKKSSKKSSKKTSKKSSKKMHGGKVLESYMKEQIKIMPELRKIFYKDGAKETIGAIPKFISVMITENPMKSKGTSKVEIMQDVVPYVKENKSKCIDKFNSIESEVKANTAKKRNERSKAKNKK